MNRLSLRAICSVLIIAAVLLGATPVSALTINATALTAPRFWIRDLSGSVVLAPLPTNGEQTVALAAGAYTFETAGGIFAFSVDAAGHFQLGHVESGFALVEAGGTQLTVLGYHFTLDARELSEPTFDVLGTGNIVDWVMNARPTTSLQGVTLLPGSAYSFHTFGGVLPFQVGIEGDFINAGACSSCFTQAGSIITVHGFQYTFNATALSEPEHVLFGHNGRTAGWSTTAQPNSTLSTYVLLPGGSYSFMTYGGSVSFQLEDTGAFTNTSDCPGCFQVSGSTVVVPGFALTLDPRALSAPDFALFGAADGRLANWSSSILPTSSLASVTLLPGGEYSVHTYGGTAAFRLTGTGAFEDRSDCPACWRVEGAHGREIKIAGFTYQIQADELTESQFLIMGRGSRRTGLTVDWLQTCGNHSVTVLPGDYSLRTYAVDQSLSVSTTGALSFSPALSPWISASPAGSNITLHGFPVSLTVNGAGLTQFNLIGASAFGPGPIGSFAAGEAHCLNLTPGQYRLDANGIPGALGSMTIGLDGSLQVTDARVVATRQAALCAASRCQTNHPPDAVAVVQGGSSTADEGSLVCLSGMGSSDPDAGDALSYSWVQTAGPAVALSAPSSAVTCFTAPRVEAAGAALSFQLKVCDTAMACDTATTGVSVRHLACRVDADCNDGNACTTDLCQSVEGVCTHEAATTAVLSDYTLFLGENYDGGHDVEGKVAAGGNVTLEDFSVGAALPANNLSKALVAGGNLSLLRGGVWGEAWYAGSYSANTSVVYPRGTVAQGHPIDFTARFARLRSLASQLANLPANGTTTREGWGGVMLRGTSTRLNVFDVNAEAFTGATLLSIDAPAGSLVVVNIRGASATFTGFGHSFSGGIDQHGILYNFVDATAINAHGYGFWGTVLAPDARVSFNNGSWDGGLYARSLTGNAEGHLNPLNDHNLCQ